MTDPTSATDPAPHTNRLVDESSPYLRQHAHNPVDWYPWGDEALTKARETDRPVFLSIGYSACHWCHVMERESFENEALANKLNENFVSIKVDREERPDLDSIYMAAVMAMTGSGGWPMTVFLTPDGRPFYGGTYFPPIRRGGMPGFGELLDRIASAWDQQRTEIDGGADELTGAVRKLVTPQPGAREFTAQTLRDAATALVGSADRQRGGFGSAPKFPHPMDLRVLLRAVDRFDGDDVATEAEAVVKTTLDHMAAGGIFDHLGGGFHRYSTDARWLAPHFEKMLYDNALLTVVYLEAWQMWQRPGDREVVERTLDYLLREMTDARGGFFATQDADSEGEEGKFFVWSESEIDSLLGSQVSDADLVLFKETFDVTPRGNWEGHTILNRTELLNRTGAVHLSDADEQRLAAASKILFDHRASRIAPGTDEKILVGWNGLAITAFARAGAVLKRPDYLDAARAAARFVLTEITDGDGRLRHSHQGGVARFNAFLDDYAAMIEATVTLYEVTGEAEWIDHAVRLADEMLARYADSDGPGLFYTPSDHEQLIVRQKDNQDTATPSGNSLAATALLRLSHLTGNATHRETAEQTLELLAGTFSRHPSAGGQALIAVDHLVGPAQELVLITGEEITPDEFASLHHALTVAFRPRTVIATQPRGGTIPAPITDLFAGRDVTAEPRLFVCENHTCAEPVVGVEGINGWTRNA